MRLNINLASQPYQDLGRFMRRWVPTLAIFLIASLLFIGWTWRQFQSGRGISKQIAQTREQIQEFDRQREVATKMLNDPANKDTTESSRFINTMIAKKSFSWTRVFMQMEQIMPDRLHIMSMTPELSPTNQLSLSIRVAGDSREQAIELVRRLEKSQSFKSAVLRSEIMLPPDPAKPGDTVMFEINAIYVPTVAPQAKPVTKDQAVAQDKTAEKDSSRTVAKEAKP